jgi:hypothetical protein
MKRLLTVVLFVSLIASVAFAGWNFEETIFDFSRADTALTMGTSSVTGETYYTGMDPHGIVVDANGNYWVATYGTVGDDFITASGDTAFYRPLRCFAPNGDIVHEITVFDLPDGGQDTLWSGSDHSGTGRGIAMDNDGNILYSSYACLYRFNYETGECTGKSFPMAASITDASQGSDGTVYFGHVGAGNPVHMLDEDFEYIGDAIDTVHHLSRSLEVVDNADGGFDMFYGTTWSSFGGMVLYHSEDPLFEAFESVDTLMQLENPDGELDAPWASSVDLRPNGDVLVGSIRKTWGGYYGSQWHVYDPTDGSIESFGVAAPDSAAANKDIYIAGGVNGPRGGFFLDNDNLVTVDFYMGTVDRWSYDPTSIEDEVEVATTFELGQNYPNPFNPTTVIPFTLAKEANVTLRVYNMLGQEVATLMNNKMTAAGYHNVNFDASQLATGMYIYRLQAGDFHQTRRMMLVK